MNFKSTNKNNTVNFEVGDGYSLLQTIGTGAYGVVCSAIHKSSNQKVAIKKISSPFEILTTAKRTLRELKLLLHFKHDNIVGVKNILHHESESSNIQDVYVVMDLMESDLHHVIRSSQPLTENHICYFVYQLLRGLKYIHSANVIHRDLKPSNLLVNENCELKIGDFGMARGVANSPEDNRNFMTEYVATRWYRAPELMLSMYEYSMAIDMWSVGCIFAEMLGRKQLFPGQHYIHQLKLIISVLGSPSTKLIGSIRSDRVRSYVQNLPHKRPVPLKTLFPKASDTVIDLLSRFLQFDPSRRESAEATLAHPFFKEYHDQDDEPTCPRIFDFRFETAQAVGGGPTKEDVKKQVINLITEYHAKRSRIKKQLIFLPAPSIPKEARPIHDNTNDNKSTENSIGTDQDVFKKPNLIPVPKSNTTKIQKVQNKDIPQTPTNIEMLSAKSEADPTCIPVTSNESDIQVSSVKITVEDSTGNTAETSSETVEVQQHQQEKLQSKVENKNADSTPKKTISETTKMRMRDMILASMLAKKNGLSKPVDKAKKPVTAAERQREREEKRRKRQEKAAEKERKKREAEGNRLSDQDKNLLERWSRMQEQAKSKPVDNTLLRERQNNDGTKNTLTRHNSLPKLASRHGNQSIRESTPVSRRWSYNNDLIKDVGGSDQKVLHYVPTLSDIPPSPNLPSDSVDRTNLPVHDMLDLSSQNSHPSYKTNIAPRIPTQNANQYNPVQANVQKQLEYYIQAQIQPAPFHSMPQHSNVKVDVVPLIQVDPPYRHSSSLPSYDDATKAIAQSNIIQHSTQPILRPSTLNVIDFQNKPSNTSPSDFVTSSNTILQSGKSLVTLSPDTVDFVLNQEFQNNGEMINLNRSHETYVGGNINDLSKECFTISPGKTSLISKTISEQEPSIFTLSQKSASIEFSPHSFLSEFDKCNREHLAYSTCYGQEIPNKNYTDTKFLNTKNGSVMLSESADCNRNEMLFVNASLTQNPLSKPKQDQSKNNFTFLNDIMVGGYGIGYEPDLEGNEQDSTKGRIFSHEQANDMECESATSSSSLLNDWLVEASQMEAHDIELLQHELELGSPMCIDDCDCKPD